MYRENKLRKEDIAIWSHDIKDTPKIDNKIFFFRFCAFLVCVFATVVFGIKLIGG